jgi:hypothetical protein
MYVSIDSILFGLLHPRKQQHQAWIDYKHSVMIMNHVIVTLQQRYTQNGRGTSEIGELTTQMYTLSWTQHRTADALTASTPSPAISVRCVESRVLVADTPPRQVPRLGGVDSRVPPPIVLHRLGEVAAE